MGIFAPALTGGKVKYRRGDGSVWTFQLDTGAPQSGVYKLAAPANRLVTLQSGPSNWTLIFKSGERKFFNNASGWLESFQDRNRNTTSITHDSWGRIIKVTDPASRHLYFHYDNLGSSEHQVTSVTSDAGMTVSYNYYADVTHDSVLLTKVIYPDRSLISFGYGSDSRGLISDVWHQDSVNAPRVLLETHTYDSRRRGLTSARANGVESITVTYPPDTWTAGP